MNTLHTLLTYYTLCINAVTFIIYGIDKYKAKKAKWRIPEVTLLMMDVFITIGSAWLLAVVPWIVCQLVVVGVKLIGEWIPFT